ncbi:mechanosensitive ion channel family protein [uncultured Dysosmobacter sp.]|uniref:mechanosensitive ion channel family protein n=1 Tax=uncultured Dysosmobacter sp. TaxID=2591384 RepID=UPI0026304D36|nr:mechanosensitive ion channel family protein [uncultured Dysosmobacter sp.]
MSDLNELLKRSVGSVSLGDVLTAVITLLVCMVVIRVLLKLIRRLLAKSKLDSRVQKYVFSGVKLLLYLVAAIIVVGSLGIDMTSLVALLSVASLGITLAAEDVLANVAGGLVLLSSHPFAIGDFIEVAGTSGTVEEISLNHTKLITADGLLVMLPNKSLADSQVTNYTALGRRRVVQKVTASYDAPTEKVKDTCQKALEMTDKVLADPAPAVWLTQYGDSSIEYTVYCWAAAGDYWDVYFALGEHLRTAFAENGVEMTYDHLNVHIVENRG